VEGDRIRKASPNPCRSSEPTPGATYFVLANDLDELRAAVRLLIGSGHPVGVLLASLHVLSVRA